MPKLQAVAQARGGNEARIYVRGDKKVDYGTMMKVMGRLSAAGFHRVALVTEFEQGSKVMQIEDGISDFGRAARRGAGVGDAVVFRHDASRRRRRIAAGRSGQRQAVLRTDQGHEGRAQAVEKPKPLVEKKAEEPKPIEEIKPKVSEKKEIAGRPRRSAPPPQPQPKPDPIAEKLKTEPDQKQAEVGKPTAAAAEEAAAKPQPKFDPDKIAALLNQRDPEREAAPGAEPNALALARRARPAAR